MGSTGVNRVVIAVRDLEKSVSLYSNMLGVSFEDASRTGEQFGITVAISWQAGVELCAPIPGQDSMVSQFLDEKGEGLMGVVFETDDLEAAKAQAETAGVAAIIPIDFSQEENRLKFFDAFGYPVDLGADGSLPTGNQPLIYMNNDFHLGSNLGSGGDFTPVNSPTDGGSVKG